jgi:hypothetical protein
MTTEDQSEANTALDVANMDYSREGFARAIDQTFSLQLDAERSVPLTLVSLLESEYSTDEFDCFSLYFSPPAGQPPFPDNSYLLHNEELGDILLHLSATLTPAGKPEDYQYEAVLNLRKS